MNKCEIPLAVGLLESRKKSAARGGRQRLAPKKSHPASSIACGVRVKKMIKQCFYFFFFQRLLMSSRVLPLVSGTSFHTNSAAATQMMP